MYFVNSWEYWAEQARIGRARSQVFPCSEPVENRPEHILVEEPLGKILSGDGNKPAEPQGSPEKEGDGHGNSGV